MAGGEIGEVLMTRRSVFRVATALGLAGLAGCGDRDTPPETTAPSGTDEETLSSATPEVLPPNPARASSPNEVVEYLGLTEERAGRQIFGHAMEFFFVGTGLDSKEYRETIGWNAAALRSELRAGGLDSPVIVMEPGEGFSFANPDEAALGRYLEDMKRAGVTDDDWGLVTVVPEFIVGGRHGNDARNYPGAVRLFLDRFSHYFPRARMTTLVDAAPMEKDRLLPVLADGAGKEIGNRIESIGIQAYANSDIITFDENGKADISGFFDPDAFQEIADAFGQKHIWINTGIPRRDIELGVTYTPKQRAAIAQAMLEAVGELRNRGYTIDLFAIFTQNKIRTEKRDFSYPDSDLEALTTLADGVHALGIPLVGFAAPAA